MFRNWNVRTSQRLWTIPSTLARPLIGSSQLSPTEDVLAVTNLVNGVDLYSASHGLLLCSLPMELDPARNRPIAVTFMKAGRALTFGAHHGDVPVWEAAWGKGSKSTLTQVLNHDGKTCLK